MDRYSKESFKNTILLSFAFALVSNDFIFSLKLSSVAYRFSSSTLLIEVLIAPSKLLTVANIFYFYF
jgi:hypothetical protein